MHNLHVHAYHLQNMQTCSIFDPIVLHTVNEVLSDEKQITLQQAMMTSSFNKS